MAVKTATTTVISGNTVKRNSGIILNAGNVNTKNRAGYREFSSLDQLTNNLNPDRLQGLVIPNNWGGVGFLIEGVAVAITAITQSGSTTYCNIQKSSHGLTVGQAIQVGGCSNPNYNVIHRVLVVTDANNVKTDCVYTTNPSTQGSYYKSTGVNFNKMVKGKYIASIIGTQVAGSASTVLVGMGNSNVQAYNSSTGSYGTSITGFDYFAGTKTTGATWGVLNKFHDIAANNENLTKEPNPTRAIPGRLVLITGALIPVAKSYNPKTT